MTLYLLGSERLAVTHKGKDKGTQHHQLKRQTRTQTPFDVRHRNSIGRRVTDPRNAIRALQIHTRTHRQRGSHLGTQTASCQAQEAGGGVWESREIEILHEPHYRHRVEQDEEQGGGSEDGEPQFEGACEVGTQGQGDHEEPDEEHDAEAEAGDECALIEFGNVDTGGDGQCQDGHGGEHEPRGCAHLYSGFGQVFGVVAYGGCWCSLVGHFVVKILVVDQVRQMLDTSHKRNSPSANQMVATDDTRLRTMFRSSAMLS